MKKTLVFSLVPPMPAFTIRYGTLAYLVLLLRERLIGRHARVPPLDPCPGHGGSARTAGYGPRDDDLDARWDSQGPGGADRLRAGHRRGHVVSPAVASRPR